MTLQTYELVVFYVGEDYAISYIICQAIVLNIKYVYGWMQHLEED